MRQFKLIRPVWHRRESGVQIFVPWLPKRAYHNWFYAPRLPWESRLRIFIRAPLPELCPKQRKQQKGPEEIPGFPHNFTWMYNFFGLESILREGDAELKHPLWAKKYAAEARTVL